MAGHSAPMRFAISRHSLGWLLATALLIALGGGLYFRAPPPGFQDGGQGPRFDLQALPATVDGDDDDPLASIRRALAPGVATLAVALRRSDDGRVVVESGGTWDAGAAPGLREVLRLGEEAGGGDLRYRFDIPTTPEDTKGPGAAPAAFAAAVIDIVRRAGVARRTTIAARDWRVLGAVRARAPRVARAYVTVEQDRNDNVQRGVAGPSPWLDGLDVDDHAASIPRAIAAAEQGDAAEPRAPRPWSVVWAPFFRDLRRADLAQAHALGIKVVPWTVNDGEIMASLIDLGVDGIATAAPDRLRTVMAARGLPLPRPASRTATREP